MHFKSYMCKLSKHHIRHTMYYIRLQNNHSLARTKYLKDLAMLGTPVWFTRMPPWYTKFGLLLVQPTKSLNFSAVDLCFKKWSESLLADVFIHHLACWPHNNSVL